MPKPVLQLPLEESLFQPGQRIAVAVSGGADSVALLLALLAQRERLGLVLSVVHVHHGIRGEAADQDQAFVEVLAAAKGLPCRTHHGNTPQLAAEHRETLEEAARNLRYTFFRSMLDSSEIDAIATAHTLDDQAETVLHKLLRGAWTEGLGGISPIVIAAKGRILRPLLALTRNEIEAYLRSLDQAWCEDATNRDLTHTRNRLRHHLLPILKEYNPQLAVQLSRLAAVARDEDAWWQKEAARVAGNLILPGKPVRGGGRSSSTHPEEQSVAFELERLRLLDPAMRRRVLRWAARHIGLSLDYEHTELLMQLCRPGSNSPKRVDLGSAALAQRTARELQLSRSLALVKPVAMEAVEIPVPGSLQYEGFTFTTTIRPADTAGAMVPMAPVLLRPARSSDRVTTRYSRAPRKVKEVWERLKVPAAGQSARMVLEWEGHILWLEGVELEPASLPTLPLLLTITT